MSMTVTRRKDTKTPRVITHRVADIRGGVSIKTSELGGDFLNEASVLSVPENGICHVIKIAVLAAALTASAKTIKVKKNHHFKAGDFIMAGVGGLASTITAIDETETAYDTLTVDQALGAFAAGTKLVQAAAKSTGTDSALKYTPLAISGTGKSVDPKSNMDMDAWIIAVTKDNPLPDCVASALKGIFNY